MLRAAVLVLALCACSPAPDAAKTAEAPAQPAAGAGITVESPLPQSRVTSPLIVRGAAQNDWYYEGVFDAELVAADGTVLDQSPAEAQSPWTEPGAVAFVAGFEFNVTQPANATIVLTEDTTGEKPEIRRVRIPVVLTP